MDLSSEQIDEYLLAAYLSPGLPPDVRQEIERYLIQHEDARDLLGMATSAMEASKGNVGAENSLAEKQTVTNVAESIAVASRQPEYSDRAGNSEDRQESTFTDWKWVVFVTVLFALTLFFIFQAAEVDADDQMSPAAGAILDGGLPMWSPSLQSSENTIRWAPISGAGEYALVIYSHDEHSILNVVSTSGTVLKDVSDVAYTFQTNQTGQISIWVLALDPEGNFIRSSSPVVLKDAR